ncbi:TonB-dependent receptor [Phenylobacterium hankyongense]|uniref:TonB-dependent receptor n=1 Tax=Phenylobacterium hankyongense TaxID=1813876 RepID=A0A328B1E6_9CAUL|nr:TonB-dependent receptor [Phenylobacterium hankyongense]RAK58818.1 TonB-dependent receptor [Phenylobacterium hankyongense]
MSNTLHLRSLLVAGASAAALVTAAPAVAQTPARTSGNVIEELVVTAQKREEAIQDVPIAVSAFSQDALQKSRIDGGPNLVLAIPNVNFSKGNFTGYNFQIRGIGSKLVAASGDAGTGIHLNNAPLIANNLFETEFYDVERVEVLRGPQGTLYGRNATGGVVNLITAKPTDRFEAALRGELSNFNGKKLRGMINLPLGDMFAVRLAGTTLNRDGFGINTVTGNDADDRNLYGYRGTVSFTPNKDLRVDVVYDYFKETDHRSRIGKQYCTKDVGPANIGGAAYSAIAPVAQIERGFFSQGCQATSLYSPDVLGTVNSQATLGGLFGALGGFQTGDAYAGKFQDPNVRNIESTFDPIYRAKTDILEVNIDANVTENLKFTSLTAYTRSDLYTRQDYNRYTPSVPFNTTPNPVNAFAAVPNYGTLLYPSLFPGGVVNDPQNGPFNRFTTSDISSANTDQFSQEFRLQSSFAGPLNFNIGANYLDYHATGDYYVMFNTGTAFYQVNNFLTSAASGGAVPYPCPQNNPACVFVDPNQDPNRSGHNYYDNYAPYHLESTAVFGELYWQMTDNFKWTAGLRYTDDKKTQENHAVTLGTPGSGVGAPPPTDPRPNLSVEFKEPTGRFGFDWKPKLGFTDETLIYAFYSRGYKAGGLNPACSAVVSCPPASFAPEFVDAYEVGTKNTLLGGSMTLNLTGFHYDYQGYQVSKIVNRTSINENIDAKINGFELESVWSPVRPVRLNASVGWLDTNISNGTSIDTFNRTQGNPGLVLVKSSAASNCVVPLANAQLGLAIANGQVPGFTPNPFNLLGLCTPVSTAGAGTNIAGSGAIAVGTNAFGGLVSDGVPVSLSGKELPNSPHWTVTLGAQYTHDFGNGWNAVLRGDYYWQAKTFSRIYNSTADRIDSWQNLNLTLTVSNAESGWSAEAFVKNATDETAITDTYLTDDSSGLFRNAFFTEPRTYGIALAKKW